MINASSESDIDAAFATLVKMRAAAVVIVGNPLFNSRRNQLAALATRYAIPAIHVVSLLLRVV